MHQDWISHDILIFWKCFNGLKNTFVYQIKKFVTSFFKVYSNRHLYLHTFLRKTPWKLYDPFITFRLQMWTINYMHISKSFSVCLWNIFENITGMPLRGHLLAARMVNIFTCRCPNRSGVGAIDSPDLFEQVLDQRCIPEVSEKIFTHNISMIRRQKMVIFGVLNVFISNFTYYNLY